MEVLEGFVEGIKYKNEDTGYIVARVNVDKSSITVVGTVPFLKESQHIKITGQWTEHRTFGKQFAISQCEEIVPTTIEGIKQYLSSGIIRGIGPVTAKKIINHFGEDTIKILDENIEKLKEVDGIGEKKFNIIKEQTENKYIYVEKTHHLNA